MPGGLGLTASLFMGARSLEAQRVAIEVTGNNLSNVNTPNSARQRVNIVTDITVDQLRFQQGLGSFVQSVQSLRSQLLDNQVIRQQSLSGLYETRADLLSLVEDTLGESLSTSETTDVEGVSSATGLQNDLTRFFDSWQRLVAEPDSTIFRNDVLEQAGTLTANIQATYTRIQELKQGVFEQANSSTAQINSLTSQIADLNNQISRSELGSNTRANDLRDRRQELLEQLSTLVNIEVYENPSNQTQLDVVLKDQTATYLVQGTNGAGAGATVRLDIASVNPTTQLIEPGTGSVYNFTTNSQLRVVATNSTTAPTLVPGTNIAVYNPLVAGGNDVITEGRLGAELRVANVDLGSGNAVPPASPFPQDLFGQFNLLANNIITLVNGIHQSATSWTPAGANGGAFFSGTNATDIAVAITDPAAIAAAGGATNPGVLDGSTAVAIANLRSNNNIGELHRQIVTDIGNTVNSARNNQEAQTLIEQQIFAQREAVSGISIDEEMINLTNYQRAFEASARFIGVIDEMLQAVIQLT